MIFSCPCVSASGCQCPFSVSSILSLSLRCSPLSHPPVARILCPGHINSVTTQSAAKIFKYFVKKMYKLKRLTYGKKYFPISICISSCDLLNFAAGIRISFTFWLNNRSLDYFPRTEHTHSFSYFPDKIKILSSPIFGMRKQNGVYLIFTHFLTVWFLGKFFENKNLDVWVSFPSVILGWNLSSCLTLDSTQRNSFRKYVKGKKFPTGPNSLKCSNDTSKLLN